MWYRVITLDGETTVVQDVSDSNRFMHVDAYPLDLDPPSYTDLTLVRLGDEACAGGDEFRVTAMRPGNQEHPLGMVRGDGVVWYDLQYVVKL